jgi:MraZ protein
MLIGQYLSKLTDKNRLAVPKKIRDEVGDKFIVAKWYEECLVLVSEEKWQDLVNRLVGLGKIIISPVRDIDRFIMASAFEINLDSQGRFVLPEELKRYAKVTSEVIFIGLGDRVEIWAQDSWKKLEENSEEKASLAIEKIAKNSVR